jgi:hypothetical protein
MKKIIYITLLFLITGCSVVTSQRQDWKFMESVGGLSVGGQDKNPNWLIIRGNVSGTQEFSSKPKTMNSALAVKTVERIFKDSKIQIYVVTTLVSDKYSDPKIYGIRIEGIKKGKYMVQYLNPDNTAVDLKEVEIY